MKHLAILKLFLSILLLIVFAAVVPLAAQRVDPRNIGFRVWAIDRVVRDEQGRKMPAHAKGKLGFVAIYNADHTRVLVEYVGDKNSDLDDVRADRDKDKDKNDSDKTKVKAFEKASTKRSDLVEAARKAGFPQIDVNRFFLRVR